MAAITPGRGFPNEFGGKTGKQIAAGFVLLVQVEASKLVLHSNDN